MRISLDQQRFKQKPIAKDIKAISKRIAGQSYQVSDIRSMAEGIGDFGQSWCPATISKGKRSVDTFEQIQIFALDFDNGVSWDEIHEKSILYNIPIIFAYETFSSVNCNKFRVVFLNDIPIQDKRVAGVIIQSLMTVFAGCDKQCKDVSRMFFGGKNLFWYNDKNPTIDIGSLIMNMCLYINNAYGKTHYTRELERFARNTGVEYNPNTQLGIFVHSLSPDNGDNSPSSIILSNEHGEKLPHFYQINFGNISKVRERKTSNHKSYRADMIDNIREHCRLFREFENGESWLYYTDLYGLAMNLIHVEKGKDFFLDIVEKSEYSTYQEKDWSFYLAYFNKKKYLPMNCNTYCPYAEECKHGTNILETAKVKYHKIVKLENADQDYCESIEAGRDLQVQFDTAMNASDDRIHVIKAQTAIGKTELYLKYMKRSGKPCLIAVPTNKLKGEVYSRARDMGLYVRKTPSILEIIDEIPEEIGCTIKSLFNSGRNHMVNNYISKIAKAIRIPALSDYLVDKYNLKQFKGHIITTHHYLLMQSSEYLKNYTIIVDEDILQTILTNQGSVSINDLLYTLDNDELLPSQVRFKIEQAIFHIGTDEFFTISGFDYKNNLDITFDLSAFVRAEKYYTDGENIYFFKKVNIERQKYIVLSATADEKIYNHFFGKDKVAFHLCRQARYKGRLTQYYDKSMSRRFIRANPELYDTIRDKFEDSVPMITFKGSLSCSDLHFGNTEGCDEMKGKDIVVVGTPHIAEFVYKLFAYQLGFEIGEKDKLQYQEVTHGGYRFWFTTYKKGILRDIQFWLIESELEQAVGRARLLRFDCCVSLFSDFPLPQSDLKLWDDFLNDPIL